jgi:phosphonate transport system substrate-binding protein
MLGGLCVQNKDMTSSPVRLIVPPHDDAGHLAGWYLLNVHLQRSLGISCVVEAGPNEDDFHHLFGTPSLIVLANAYQTPQGQRQGGWYPVARPVGVYDELLVLARRDPARAGARHPVRVGCASRHSWVPRAGMETLALQGLLDDDCAITAFGSEAAAIQSLLQGETDLVLLDDRAWSGLGPALRDQLYRVTESRLRRCFSTLCLSPDLAALRAPLLELLSQLPTHPTGEHLLTDLGYPGFEPVPPAALAELSAWLLESTLA